MLQRLNIKQFILHQKDSTLVMRFLNRATKFGNYTQLKTNVYFKYIDI